MIRNLKKQIELNEKKVNDFLKENEYINLGKVDNKKNIYVVKDNLNDEFLLFELNNKKGEVFIDKDYGIYKYKTREDLDKMIKYLKNKSKG